MALKVLSSPYIHEFVRAINSLSVAQRRQFWLELGLHRQDQQRKFVELVDSVLAEPPTDAAALVKFRSIMKDNWRD